MDDSLAIRAAWLSYIGGCTQADIARRLGVSSPKAHRLINQVHRDGLVHVFIDGVPHECLEMGERIQQAFALASCTVAPLVENSAADDPLAPFNAVGAAAAGWLHHRIKGADALTLGVGKGRSLAAMIRGFPRLNRPDLQVVAVSGSLTRKMSANPFDIVHNLVERTAGDGYFLPVPYIARSPEERELLQAQPSVREILELGRRADLYVIGVGAIASDGAEAHIRQTRMVDDGEWQELLERGAVCDIMGEFLDADGRAIAGPLNRLAIGLRPADLRGGQVMAVVGGRGKGRALRAALGAGVITDLVVCEGIARDLLASMRGDAS